MTEMMERVEEAIFHAWFETRADNPRDFKREIARAAVEAMREPTPAMLGTLQMGRCDTEKELRETYQAMIDAALSGEGERPEERR